MEGLNSVLTWILEIGGVAVISLGALLWLRAAQKSQSTARSFMALVFTIIFFIVAVLRSSDFDAGTIRCFTIVYGGILAFYIIARMIEHSEEIRSGKKKKISDPAE